MLIRTGRATPGRATPWGLPRGASADALLDAWSRSRHREVVPAQLGYLVAGRERRPRRRPGRRRLPPLPLLQLLVEPAASIDFADPVTGFAGFTRLPPPERVLTLWADDLLSVGHGTDWTFVVDADQAFDRAWLELLTPPRRGPLGAAFAVVSAAFAGPTPAGEFRVADVDATTYTTLVHVADRRGGRRGRRA